MAKNKLLSAVLSLFLLIPASIIRAQTVSSQKGLTTAVFNLQQGIIKVYLPDDIRPGDIISGRIVAEPVGKNEKRTANNLAGLMIYSISIGNIKFPVDNAGKSLQISIPSGNPTACHVGLINSAGIQMAETIVPTIPENELSTTSSGCNIPSHALTGSPLRITGPFDGNSSNTQISLDNKPMEVLAESPRECVVSYPSTVEGVQTLNVQESGKPACFNKINAVNLNITAGKLSLLRGEKTYIDLKITGLQNLPDTARLTLTNISTNVISMVDGNDIAVSIPPASDTKGTYYRRFNVQSIKTGTFTVNVNLDLPEASSAPIPVTTTQTQSLSNTKLRLVVDGDLISVDNKGEQAEENPGKPAQVYIYGNTIRIFYNGFFITQFDMTNPGSGSVQDIMTEYSNPDYPDPEIGCDSLNRICNKTLAFNVFWGDVFSVYEGVAQSRHFKGETVENAKNSSLLITRGWEIDCCTGEFKLKLFFHAIQDVNGEGTYNASFMKVLKTGKPCPIKCPACTQNCNVMKSKLEELNKKREEIRKKNGG